VWPLMGPLIRPPEGSSAASWARSDAGEDVRRSAGAGAPAGSESTRGRPRPRPGRPDGRTCERRGEAGGPPLPRGARSAARFSSSTRSTLASACSRGMRPSLIAAVAPSMTGPGSPEVSAYSETCRDVNSESCRRMYSETCRTDRS